MPRYKSRFRGKQTIPKDAPMHTRSSSRVSNNNHMKRAPLTYLAVVEMMEREEKQALISR